MNYLQSLLLMEGGWEPKVEVSPNCPRCGSSNTKFCYYNNYSLTQPRYFCKGCRRYWTKGGSLRNIPVGGGCRKNRRGKSIRLSTSDIMSSRSPGFRGQPNHLLGLSHGSSSSTGPPNIDLALVYANFLNPQPPGSNTVSGYEPQEEPNSSDTNNGQSMDPSISSTGLLEAAGNGFLGWESLSDPFADTHLNRDGNDPNNPTPIFDHPTLDDTLQAVLHGKAIQQCGSDGSNFHGLAPLPGEDAACRESLASWSGLHHLLVDDHDRSLQAPELPVPMSMPELRQGEAEDPNLLIRAGYREFDFPEGEDVFPRK